MRFAGSMVRWMGVPALLLLLGTPAAGQSDDELAHGRKLYSQGVTQEAASDWTGALASFEQVARIKLTPQVRFHIARCKEHLGRLNEALGGYRMAEYEAEHGTSKDQEILDDVRAAREALEQRVPRLTIVRGKNAATIKIELDGVALGNAQIGQEITLDPGPHVVAGIVGPGKRFESPVEIGEREHPTVVLDVPANLLAPEPKPPAKAAPEPATEPSNPPSRSAKSGGAGPWIVGGAGVAALVASGVFYALRNSEQKKLEDGCIGRTCPDTLRDTQSKGETYAAMSGVLLGVGLAGLGASTLMFLGRSSEPAPAKAETWYGVSYSGRF